MKGAFLFTPQRTQMPCSKRMTALTGGVESHHVQMSDSLLALVSVLTVAFVLFGTWLYVSALNKIMDEKRRSYLKTYRRNIVNDLDLRYVRDDLINQGVLSPEESIQLQGSSPETVSKLLDLLINKKGNKEYELFVKILKKDYSWLHKELEIIEDNQPIAGGSVPNSVKDLLSRGDVPRLPVRYVRRLDLEEIVTAQLGALKRHKMLVLHGMPGTGKTSLAISALSNYSLIKNSFDENVFWINCYPDEQIVTLQARICKRLLIEDNASFSDSVSETSFTFHSIYSEPNFWKDYRRILKTAFEEDTYKESLLVIDNPPDEKTLEAFDVGCKVLVTTQDLEITKKYEPTIIQISSLTEAESLELIASCVEKSVSQLPRQAKEVHSICKGIPLLMAMVGTILADNKEKLNHNTHNWKDFVKKLTKKDNILDKIFFNPKQSTTLQTCINSLNDDKKIKIYQSLAVLPRNVKVPTKALSVIIDVVEAEVEPLMKLFENKCLVMKDFSTELNSYQYEIHDMTMLYLKTVHNREETKKLHSNLILRYKEKCLKKSLLYLPDDGYIGIYIGYHIFHADNEHCMYDLFNTLYTDIVFIGNKIRMAGPTDFKQDLERYFDKIVKKEKERDFIVELNKFLENHAYDLHRYKKTNIIQSILQHSPKGILSEKALQIAMSEDYKRNIFFQLQEEEDSQETNFTTLDVGDTICAVQFLGDNILVGNACGIITLWDSIDKVKIKKFHGHNKAIRSIAVNHKAPYKIASTSDDGTLNIWHVDDIHSDTSTFDSSEMEDNFHDHTDTQDSSVTIRHPAGALGHVCWGHHSDILLTHTASGSCVLLYSEPVSEPHDYLKHHKQVKTAQGFSVTCSILSVDDSLIIFGQEGGSLLDKKYSINVYRIKTEEIMMTFAESAPILLLATIPGQPQKVLALTTLYLQKYQWDHNAPSSIMQISSHLNHTKIADISELQREYQFQTASVSADGLYIFISTTESRIFIYSLSSNYPIYDLNNLRGVVHAMDSRMYWDTENNACYYYLVTKSGDNSIHTVKLWYLSTSMLALQTEPSKKVKLSLKFDCIFKPISLSSPVLSDYTGTPVRRSETMGRSVENIPKICVQKSISLDRKTVRLLNLNGCNFHLEPPYNPLIAVVDRNNKIQILNGKKLICESKVSEDIISTIKLSPCGQYLAYGLKKGFVNLFFLKSKKTIKIMDLNDDVNYLEFLNANLLIAAGKNSGLMVYESLRDSLTMQFSTQAKMIIRSEFELGSQELLNDLNGSKKSHRCHGGTKGSLEKSPTASLNFYANEYPNNLKKLRTAPIVKCYYLDDLGLLTVALDGNIKLWNLDPSLLSVLIEPQKLSVSYVSMHENNTLVLCYNTGDFQIYRLIKKEQSLSVHLIHSNILHFPITCSDISADGKILAMGLMNGDIQLWRIPSRVKRIVTLKLHKSTVHKLKFSPRCLAAEGPSSPLGNRSFHFPPSTSPTAKESLTSHPPTSPLSPSGHQDNTSQLPFVLVSLSDQVAWWNISFILADAQNKSQSKGGSTFHLTFSQTDLVSPTTDRVTSILENERLQNDSFNYSDEQWESSWKNKVSKEDDSPILACIKLVGDKAENLMVDEKFSKFVTIDQSGTLSIMNVLNNNGNGDNNNGS